MKEPRVNLSDRRSFKNKKVNVKYTLKRLLSYLKPTLPLFTVVFLGNLLSVVLSLLGPYICGLAVGEIKTDGTTDFTAITYYCVILAAVYIASELINYATTVGMAYVARKMTNKMRGDLFRKLVHLPVGYFDNRQAGDVISVLSYDIDTVGASLANDVVLVLKSAVLIVGSLIMMLIIAAPLVAVFAVTVPLSLIMTKIITKKVQPLFRRRSAKLGELNGFAEEVLAGQKTTKAYNREEEILRRFQDRNEAANDAYTTAEYYGTISGPSVGFVNNLSLTLISVLGALMFAFGWGGVGISQISSFVLYSRKFSGPINEIANVIGEFQSSIAAAERVFTVLEEREEELEGEGAETLENVKGDVEIVGVNFGYVPEKPVLKNFSLHAESGDLIAIVGKTGAGKTTVINLLMRFYDADAGTIKIDGRDIKSVTRSSLRGAFTMVLQDTWLFAGTVYENLAYGAENVTREQVEEVCKKARIHSFITRLPQGYDTLLTDNAVNISKGQKQLLTIARAMLSPSPVLILDEATSNVDTRTEQIIQSAMTELMKGKTCFVIAHRLSTVQNADKILVMDGGNAVEQGTHAELMDKKGYYYNLYNSQFESY
ncbi:MAG: ABC transporter ATP-binding protein/permease [Clostridiales bacterium]|nr:ABC transporter ATP-binding protein/permease [Clostridiales bacterium]